MLKFARNGENVDPEDLFRETEGCPPITTPFGTRYVIGTDIMASGYICRSVERSMKVVHRYYANTHSNAHNGKMMSKLIDWSKGIIRSAVGANDSDKVIFTGSGCSGAIIHLIHTLDIPSVKKERAKAGAGAGAGVVVFISAAEHHSNHLPWTHTCAELEVIPLNAKTREIDTDVLREKVMDYSERGYAVISSFNAGSNVTGVIQNTSSIARIIHSVGGIVIFDYAGSGPYVEIDMHADDAGGDYYDAIVVSPHKFLGGPGAPGLLVASEKMFNNGVPFGPCGGTVRFVCKSFKKYCDSVETRESGGTPNILGAIRTGMAFRIKRDLQAYINIREKEICAMVEPGLESLEREGLIKVLYPKSGSGRLPVFPFVVPGYHYNLIVVLLNDLFGIQSRGGISCCGMLAETLLDLKDCDRCRVYQSILNAKGVPPDYGWVRMSMHYSMPDSHLEYVLMAVDFVVRNAEPLASLYKYVPGANNWIRDDVEWVAPYEKLVDLETLMDLDTMSVYGDEPKYLTREMLKRQFAQTVVWFGKQAGIVAEE